METELTEPAVPPEGVDRESFTVAYLANHEAQCPACGYNVHKLTQARCPECGRPLTVQVVTPASGFTWPWMVSLVVLGLASGVGVLVLAVVIHEGLREPMPFRAVLIYFMCNIPLPLTVLAVRRWFVRWSGAVQWIIAALLLAATASMFGWFLSYIGP